MRLLLALPLVLLAVSPASAATPSSGSVSLASPTVEWTGKAPGYGVVIVNSFVTRTCQAPACDEFTLEVTESGDLTVSATALRSSGFTELDVVRPDGSTISNDGGAGQPISELQLKRVQPGTYLVRTHTNAPAYNSGDYTARAQLTPSRVRPTPPPPSLPEGQGEGGPKDATVVAIVDSSFNPYHWDFLASRMPQLTNADGGDDLPLDRPASEWLPGYAGGPLQRVDLTLEENDAEASIQGLSAEDGQVWDAFPSSTREDVNLTWFPNTKIIAAATFARGGRFVGGTTAHGFGTSSALAGNIHGTCPECLLVLVQYRGEEAGEAAVDWAMSQPWIDVVSNSYGFHSVGDQADGQVQFRDNVYAGSDLEAQRTAVERGQTILYSAGNGIENGFVTPNSSGHSSQKGPDWMITVGAVSPPEDGHYPAFTDDETDERSGAMGGAGKPVDVASVGFDYPTAYSATGVGLTGGTGFSGTSNATPVVAGTYARSLYRARSVLTGPSRVQQNGVIATGDAVPCGPARPGCELGDGVLTSAELRTRLLHGAVPTGNGTTVAGQLVYPTLPAVGEETLMAEGHGSYLGRVRGDNDSGEWLAEQDRVFAPLVGAADVLARPDGENEWMTVQSYCSQRNWGAWSGGYYVEGLSELPGDSPQWPVRTAWKNACPGGPQAAEIAENAPEPPDVDTTP